MTKRQLITIYIVGALMIAILVFTGLSWQRGVITLEGYKPIFHLNAITHPRPSLDRPINFPDSFNETAKTIYQQNLEKVKNTVRDNPNNDGAWLDLAIMYRMVNDHEGAVEIWKYILGKNPQDTVAMHNLGEYYFHTAKDYPTAERYYLDSIKLSPHLTQNYLDLFDMYRYVYKQDTSAAVDILKEGGGWVSDQETVSFYILLGQYYQEKGDAESARKAYQEALELAKKIESTEQIKQIQLLLSTIK